MEDFVRPMSSASVAVDKTLERISRQNGVKTLIVLNEDDLPIRSNVDSTSTMAYANTCRTMEKLARHTVRELDPANDLILLRVRTAKNEIIIAPEQKNLLVVVQTHMTSSD